MADTAYTTEAAKDEVKPILLVMILDVPLLNNPSVKNSLYLTDYYEKNSEGVSVPVNINFFDEDDNPVVYNACALSYDKVEVSTSNTIDQCTLNLDNVTNQFTSLAKDYELRSVRVHVLKAFRETLATPDGAITLFVGHIESVVIGEFAMSAAIWADFNLNTQIPRRLYWARDFPLLPSSKDVRKVFIKK